MVVLELALVNIGAAITKSLLSSWLQNSGVVTSAGVSIIDILAQRTGDYLQSREVARRFNQMGDKVAANLRSLFRGAELDDARRTAVANQVSSVIESANINTPLLARLENSPLKLYRYLRTANSLPDHFSEAEKSLFERALEESANYLIELLRELPSFVPDNLTEVLRLLNIHEGKLDAILQGIENIRMASEAANSDELFATFEARYRLYLSKKLDQVELFGATLGMNIKKYRLSVAYINLHVHEANDLRRVDGPPSMRASVDEALTESQYNLLIGEAGSGKTTLLKWLAVRAAQNDFENAFKRWENIVPFFLELRRFKESLPSPEEFLRTTVPSLAGEMPPEWVHRILRSGRGLILVDGFDEVPPEQRDSVSEWLDDIVLTFPAVHIVLSSRPSAVTLTDLMLDESKWFLAPMTTEDIERFVRYWHEAVLENTGVKTHDETVVIQEKLLSNLWDNSPLMHLATNPLLCAMICALHYDRDMHLPRQRTELYEACVEMLLERRDVERNVHHSTLPQLDLRQKRLLMEDLAFWMMSNNYSTVERSLVVQRLKLKLQNMTNLETEVGEVLDMLIERSGLLRSISATEIDFIHRTFQEYLAASLAKREAQWGILLEKADLDQWHETIILSMGFANLNEADSFISKLLKQGGRTKKRQAYYDLLAIACAEAAVELSPPLKEEVRQRVGVLVPPTTPEAVAALVSAGDLATDFLYYSENFTDPEKAACITVLARIGSIDALRAMATYLPGSDQTAAVVTLSLGGFQPQDVTSSGLGHKLIAQISEQVERQELTVPGSLLRAVTREPISTWKNDTFHNLRKLP